ncbi:intermembrane transport protein PqiB [Hydrocarboniclastica marina]|uniref:MCE family protein n=1 Tax=Hydrocarboniclastica marina TaxID=2259620 RepID=A0A4V1D904_9ALTE|nr:intermembrane transport protein PqiB [Hydrocarboniclastica marina]QCF27000.1 MCE family protein [Hydrocarboniclastica marina]
MSNGINPNSERAVKRKQARISPIWIVPLVAVLIGLWMLYDNYASRGPVITLLLENAEGVEPGKTLIKARNVKVGRVETVQLSDDFNHAIITASMSPDSERMLNEQSRFWVVKPRIDREGISGLSTVLSGAYIELLPGRGDEPQRRFEALENEPVAPPNAEGLRVELVSKLGSALSTGDPVTYQGYEVGRVEATEFDPETRELRHSLYIHRPYTVLVTENTRFWSASGVTLRMDSQGFQASVESLETLIGGGVTFGIPNDGERGDEAQSGDVFTLYANRDSAHQGTYSRHLEYVLMVDGSVRGLDPGAPVEYRGVRVGTVASVPWRFTAPQPDSTGRFAIPVLIHFEPQRFEDISADFDIEDWKTRIARLFDRGLRAKLKTGNYLTQSLYVNLIFDREAPDYQLASFEGKTVFPTVPGGLSQLGDQVSALMDKLNKLQVEPILASLDSNLQTSQATLEEVQRTAQVVQELLSDPNVQDVPGNLNETLDKLRTTLDGFSPDSRAYREMSDTLQQFQVLLDDLQPVARTLREQPNALIFNRTKTDDPEPRAQE